jgi:CRP-like cAMP-binding protein
MKQTMYDTILELPLFQGLSAADLTRVLEGTRLAFDTIVPGSYLFRQDELCTGLTFIIEGTITLHTESADHRWSLDEELSGATVLGMDVLYGSTRTHRHSAQAVTVTRILFMDKRTVAALIGYFEVFRLNVLNLLTTSAVRRDHLNWLPAPNTREEHIIHFFRTHVQRPAGHKRFNISQKVLGRYMDEDYRFIAQSLRKMQDLGWLTLGRRCIDIPTFERLIQS